VTIRSKPLDQIVSTNKSGVGTSNKIPMILRDVVIFFSHLCQGVLRPWQMLSMLHEMPRAFNPSVKIVRNQLDDGMFCCV
jgi:hypothetical protein